MSSNQHNGSDQRRLQEMLQRLDRLRQDNQELRRSLQPGVTAWLVELTGSESEVEAMLSDWKIADQLLQHGNPGVRAAALHVLIAHWGLSNKYRQLVEDIALGKEDTRVRLLAFDLMPIVCVPGSARGHLGRRLAHIIRENTELAEIRASAYQAFVRLSAHSAVDRLKPRRIRFPEEVDWAVVDQALLEEDR